MNDENWLYELQREGDKTERRAGTFQFNRYVNALVVLNLEMLCWPGDAGWYLYKI